jgi:hypothetical protein
LKALLLAVVELVGGAQAVERGLGVQAHELIELVEQEGVLDSVETTVRPA